MVCAAGTPIRLAACLALAGLLGVRTASAADRFVAVAGSDAGNDCLAVATPCRTIANAISQADSGDTIKLAAGRYRENLVLDAPGTLTIAGGWTADFSTQDPAVNATRVDGGRAAGVFAVAAGAGEAIDLTLDGLTIQRGGPIFGGVQGAGVRATTSGDGSLTLTIRSCILRNNHGSGGGGIYAASSPPGSLTLVVLDSTLKRNKGNLGDGGGIAVVGAVSLRVEDSTFENNKTGGTAAVVRCGSPRVGVPSPSAAVLLRVTRWIRMASEGERASASCPSPGPDLRV